MNIAEKLETIAENEQKVFDAGKRTEYDRFWDTFQDSGNALNYYYKFAYTGWNDEIYNPKHPIVCATGSTPGMALFYSNQKIADTKVPITVLGSSAQSMFASAYNLVTVRLLSVHEGVNFSSTFSYCEKLKNITFEGVIGKNISFAQSPLTAESMNNVISCLKDYSATGGTYTVTFRTDRETMLTDEEKAAATEKGWTLVWS